MEHLGRAVAKAFGARTTQASSQDCVKAVDAQNPEL